MDSDINDFQELFTRLAARGDMSDVTDLFNAVMSSNDTVNAARHVAQDRDLRHTLRYLAHAFGFP